MNYEDMSIDQLTELIAHLGREREAIKAKMEEIVQVRDAKLLVAETERRVALMSDPEKRALLQALAPEGIPSAEAVGTPGAEEPPMEPGSRRFWPFR